MSKSLGQLQENRIRSSFLAIAKKSDKDDFELFDEFKTSKNILFDVS